MAAKEGHYVELTIKLAPEEGQWTAECDELGTAAFGDTAEEALDAVRELITLHLNTLESLGARAAFFRKHNIRLRQGRPPARPRRVTLRLAPDELVKRVTEPIAVAG